MRQDLSGRRGGDASTALVVVVVDVRGVMSSSTGGANRTRGSFSSGLLPLPFGIEMWLLLLLEEQEEEGGGAKSCTNEGMAGGFLRINNVRVVGLAQHFLWLLFSTTSW